jgi:hypothetical protein
MAAALASRRPTAARASDRLLTQSEVGALALYPCGIAELWKPSGNAASASDSSSERRKRAACAADFVRAARSWPVGASALLTLRLVICAPRAGTAGSRPGARPGGEGVACCDPRRPPLSRRGGEARRSPPTEITICRPAVLPIDGAQIWGAQIRRACSARIPSRARAFVCEPSYGLRRRWERSRGSPQPPAGKGATSAR